mgnify:FL=1
MPSTNSANQCKIVFTPSGKRGVFKQGTSLLDAARQLGVDLDSVCGGRALCGRCQIEVSEGDFSKHNIQSTLKSVSKFNEAEAKYEERRNLVDGRRLSCQAQLVSDVVVDVPADSQVHQQVIRKKNEAHDIDIDPVVKLYYVKVDEPDMHIGTGDLSRLLEALSTEWNLNNLFCSVHVIKSLQKVLRKGNWETTVAVRDNNEIIAIWPGFKENIYGVAIDVGSTTIAAHLCELSSGEVIGSSGKMLSLIHI